MTLKALIFAGFTLLATQIHAQTIDEALDAVPEEWWAQKKEELTPLEWKIAQISQNPDLKSKLADQLDQLLAEAKSSSVH